MSASSTEYAALGGDAYGAVSKEGDTQLANKISQINLVIHRVTDVAAKSPSHPVLIYSLL